MSMLKNIRDSIKKHQESCYSDEVKDPRLKVEGVQMPTTEANH